MVPNEMVLAGLLYVPTHLVREDAIARYTMVNPAYAEARRAGAWRPKAPPTIYAYKEFGEYVGFPPYAEPYFLTDHRIPVRDIRCKGSKFKFTFREDKAKIRPDLYPEQQLAVQKLVRRGYGMLVAKPGQGKTNTIIWMLSKLGLNAIIFVQTGQIQQQWRDRFIQRDPKIGGVAWTDVGKEDIAMIGDGKKKYKGEPICIAMLQTTNRSLLEDKALMHNFGVAVVDECLDLFTPISTPYGEAMLKDLHPGDKVISYNFEQQYFEHDTVIAESEKEDDIFEVVVEVDGIPRKLICSGKHPFFLEDGSEVFARDLLPGKKVLTVT